MVTRVSTRRLLLQNRLALGHMMNWGKHCVPVANLGRMLASALVASLGTAYKRVLADVRFWPIADITVCTAHVCFGG
jgi:hypothetical protein